MKREIIAILTGLCILSRLCIADPQAIETLTIAAASTNAAAITADTATTTVPNTGYIDYIDVDITSDDYASPTCTVTVATSGTTGTRPAKTIVSKVIAADTCFYPSVLFDTSAGADITGAARRFPLSDDKITVSAYANNTTNVVQAIFLIGITKQP